MPCRRPARPLVGRGPQLRLLLDAVTSPPALVQVKGEAGIGKSRLVRELTGGAEAGRRQMLLGHCHRVRERFTLGPVIEALRAARAPLRGRPLTQLAGTLRPLLPELGDLLPPALEPLRDPRAQRHRTFRALRELLEALGPTVCVLEDLHWADAGTLDFLSFLLAEPPVELALVVTYRCEELDVVLRPLAARLPASDTTIELAPLSADEVRSLAASLLDDADVSRQTAMSLHARTGGVPFAVEEVVRCIRERCRRPLTAAELEHRVLADRRVPPRVGQAVLEGLARLGDDAGAVAHACAVVGEPATEDVLSRIAELTAARTIEALVEALGAGLLADHGRGRYGVRHDLAAQAVYESIPTPRRRRMHLRAARALEQCPPAPPAQIAHHLREAGRSTEWMRYAEAAADAACAVGDDRTAARLLEEALGATDVPRATRIRMASKLGDAALFGRVPRLAIEILRTTLGDVRLPAGVRGELRLHLAKLLLSAGDDTTTQSCFGRPRSSGGDPGSVAGHTRSSRTGDRWRATRATGSPGLSAPSRPPAGPPIRSWRLKPRRRGPSSCSTAAIQRAGARPTSCHGGRPRSGSGSSSSARASTWPRPPCSWVITGGRSRCSTRGTGSAASSATTASPSASRR